MEEQEVPGKSRQHENSGEERLSFLKWLTKKLFLTLEER